MVTKAWRLWHMTQQHAFMMLPCCVASRAMMHYIVQVQAAGKSCVQHRLQCTGVFDQEGCML
jgi:hypothetical protein